MDTMERHHVTVLPEHVKVATREAEMASRQAVTDGLTGLEAQRVYAKTYARVIAERTPRASA